MLNPYVVTVAKEKRGFPLPGNWQQVGSHMRQLDKIDSTPKNPNP